MNKMESIQKLNLNGLFTFTERRKCLNRNFREKILTVENNLREITNFFIVKNLSN